MTPAPALYAVAFNAHGDFYRRDTRPPRVVALATKFSTFAEAAMVAEARDGAVLCVLPSAMAAAERHAAELGWTHQQPQSAP